MIPDSLATQPIFLCVDDTMVAKAGTRFENVSKLFDHAAHNGSNYLNGHCFVSIMLCIPVWKNDRISYLSLPLGYRMWQKKESKLELAASMIRQVMPEFQEKKQVIILCDSWYTKQNVVSIVDEYQNLDLIGNARIDSVMYDPAPAHTGRRGRPVKHGKRLSVETDFAFSILQMICYCDDILWWIGITVFPYKLILGTRIVPRNSILINIFNSLCYKLSVNFWDCHDKHLHFNEYTKFVISLNGCFDTHNR